MAQFFIAASGSDSTGTGTISLPWATFSHAYANSVAGDTLSGNGGDTITDNIVGTSAGGARTLNSYGTGQVTVAGGSSAVTFLATNIAGWSISNVIFTNADTTHTFDCVQFVFTDGATHNQGITLNGCTVTGGFNGIHVTTSGASFVGNILVENCTVSGQFNAGISTNSGLTSRSSFSNVNVTGCIISGVTGYSVAGSSGIGILLNGCNNSISNNFIQNCLVFNCGASAVDTTGAAGPAGMFPFFSDHVIMRANVVHDIFQATGAGADGIGIDIDDGNTNCQIIGNYIYNCQGPGLTFLSNLVSGSTHVIANNVVVNCCTTGADGTHFWFTGTDTCQIYNNTIIANSAFPPMVFAGGSGVGKTILNNCMIAPAGVVSVSIASVLTGLVMDGNYQQSGIGAFKAASLNGTVTSLSAWRSANGLEASGVGAGNCYFVQPQPIPALMPSTLAGSAVFAPASSSPLIGAGVSLSSHGITPGPDILGNAYVQSIGAIYAAGTPTGYMAAVLADDPMILLRLAEPSGTIFRDSTATLQSGAWTSATLGQATIVVGDGSPGSVGFNGTSSVGTLPTINGDYAMSSVSVECWFNPLNVTAAQELVVSNNAAISNNDFFVALGGGSLTFNCHDTAGNVCQSSCVFAFSVGQIYHVLCTQTANVATIYINGVSQTVIFGTKTIATTRTLSEILVGATGQGASFFDGFISNVAVYPTVLSAGRALAHYTAGITSAFIAAALNFGGGFNNDFSGGIDS
jgi:hypothetical protein